MICACPHEVLLLISARQPFGWQHIGLALQSRCAFEPHLGWADAATENRDYGLGFRV